MIRQHYLQQQRLNNNHERILERYTGLFTPHISEFRTFGSSSLPGRNYEQHLNTMTGNHRNRESLAAMSRAGIGSSNEIYRWMGQGASETLPRNINSVMQHTREQSVPLVHAEKFEPVKIYDHPVFGPTPAYLRPVYNEREHREHVQDHHNDADDEDDDEVRSHISGDISLRINNKEERKTPITNVNDENDLSSQAPKGYISYKKWKEKHGNLIPVNPLLFSIYTQRHNGSIDSYGQSLYSSPIHQRQRQLSGDDDILTSNTSDLGSVTSDTPHATSLTSASRYHKLKPQFHPTNITHRALEPIRAESESSDDEPSPPDSPVPYLSRNRPNPITPVSLSTTIPTTSVISPSIPTTRIEPLSSSTTVPTTSIYTPPMSTTVTSSTSNPLASNTTGTSFPALNSTSTSNIPPAPPMPASLQITSSNIPPAPPMPSSLQTTAPNITYQSLSTLPIPTIPRAPPMSTSLSIPSSTTAYQTPSNNTLPPPSAPSVVGSVATTNSAKAVTFGGSSSIPVENDDVSSSSDSDDDAQKKSRRRKKRQAAAAAGGVVDSSSSDD